MEGDKVLKRGPEKDFRKRPDILGGGAVIKRTVPRTTVQQRGGDKGVPRQITGKKLPRNGRLLEKKRKNTTQGGGNTFRSREILQSE